MASFLDGYLTDAFFVDANGQLNASWVVGEGAWNGPLQIGPAGLANPGAFLATSPQFGFDQTDVFLVDTNGQLNVFWAVGEGAWNGPSQIGPPNLANPGSYIETSRQFWFDQTDVFLIDTNGQLNVFWVVGEGTWNGPLQIGPPGLANPGSVIVASQHYGVNQTDVFLVDTNGQLNVFWVVGEGTWNGPLQIGPPGLADPGSVIVASQQYGFNQTGVFLVDTNGQLNVFWAVGGGMWNGPLQIGPPGLADSGGVIAASQQFWFNQTDVFVVDTNGQLNVFWVVGEGSWNGPLQIGPPVLATPGAFLATSPQFGFDQTDAGQSHFKPEPGS
jgi:hypothetical protein